MSDRRPRAIVAAAGLAWLAAAVAPASGTAVTARVWTERTSTGLPADSSTLDPTGTTCMPACSTVTYGDLAMTADLGRGSTFLLEDVDCSGSVFFCPPQPDSEMWSSKAGTWSRMAAQVPDYLTTAAYDPATGTVVAVTGCNMLYPATCGSPAATWSWNGGAWTRLSPAASPPRMMTAVSVYDSTRRQVLLVGDLATGAGTSWTSHTQVWTWDGTTWTRHAAGALPGGHDDSVADDPAQGAVLLLGGGACSGSCSDAAQTWLWNGATWTHPSPQVRPPAAADVVWDPVGRAVLAEDGETWRWSGLEWLPQAAPGPGREPMTFDPGLGLLVASAGTDLWGYRTPPA